MIGGDRTDRLIPVPYSKSSTDQAVRESRTASGRLRSGAAETPVRGKIRFCAAVRHSAPQAILLCLSLLFLPSPSQPHRNWSFIREFALATLYLLGSRVLWRALGLLRGKKNERNLSTPSCSRAVRGNIFFLSSNTRCPKIETPNPSYEC